MKVEHLEDKSSYNIRFTNKIKESIKSLSKKYKKVAIVTDKNIWSIYSGTLKNKDVLNILIRPGEKSKSILVKNYIWVKKEVYIIFPKKEKFICN